jgi:hypothetical protein
VRRAGATRVPINKHAHVCHTRTPQNTAKAMAEKRPAPNDSATAIPIAKRAHVQTESEFPLLNRDLNVVLNTAVNQRLYDLAKRTSSMLFLVESVEVRNKTASLSLMDDLGMLVIDLEEIARTNAFASLDKYENALDKLQPRIDSTLAAMAVADAEARAATEEEKKDFRRIEALCDKYTAKVATAHKTANAVHSALSPPCDCPRESIIAATAKLVLKHTILAGTELPRAYQEAKVCKDVEKKAKIETQCHMIAKWLAKAARALDLDEKDKHDPLAKVSTLFAADAAEEFEKLWVLVPFLV